MGWIFSGNILVAASADISADKVPDLQAAIAVLVVGVASEHGEAERSLGVSCTSRRRP
jgi:hypothetical protein